MRSRGTEPSSHLVVRASFLISIVFLVSETVRQVEAVTQATAGNETVFNLLLTLSL